MEAHKPMSPSYPGRKQRRLRQILLEALSSPVLRWATDEGGLGWHYSRDRCVGYYVQHMFDVTRPGVDEMTYFLTKIEGIPEAQLVSVTKFFLLWNGRYLTTLKAHGPDGAELYKHVLDSLAAHATQELPTLHSLREFVGSMTFFRREAVTPNRGVLDDFWMTLLEFCTMREDWMEERRRILAAQTRANLR